MKAILNILFALFLMNISLGQTSQEKIFEDNPPHQPPAIFAASMPPCLIGVANQYGEVLGVSELTLKEAKAFITEVHAKVPEFKQRVRKLELQLVQASKDEKYDVYEKLLRELSEVKIEASLFHESLVKRARKKFMPKDVGILDRFIVNNQEEFMKGPKLNK
ncbi:MAG: hypothetical protein CR994_08090 [Maribacter sp.]|nr:MAG: hypothetical protein CR994_08090 [Maribacter sp.]